MIHLQWISATSSHFILQRVYIAYSLFQRAFHIGYVANARRRVPAARACTAQGSILSFPSSEVRSEEDIWTRTGHVPTTHTVSDVLIVVQHKERKTSLTLMIIVSVRDAKRGDVTVLISVKKVSHS